MRRPSNNAMIVIRLTDLNRYSLAYVVPIIESYVISRKFVNYEVVKDNFVKNVRDFCEKYDKVIVMYSLMTPQIFDLINEFRELRDLKKRYKNIVMIAGGPHASGDPVGTIRRLGFDIAVLREGELSIPKLLDVLIFNVGTLEEVPNIAYAVGDVVRETEFKLTKNILSFPPCSDRARLYAPIEIMRGCRHACKYCQTPRIYRFQVRYRSLDYVYTWCRHYFRRGMKILRFLAPNGFAYGSDCRTPRPEKLEKLLKTAYEACEGKASINLGVFPSEVRPDFVKREVLEVVVKYVSNRRLAIGAQTGSDRLLNYIGRGHDSQCIYEAVDIAIEYGFQPYVDLIFGLPGETEEDIDETIKLMQYLAKRGCIIRGHTFMPLPGTPFEKAPPGKIHPKYWPVLRELERAKKLEGYWKEQEKIAELIHRYLTSSEPLV